MNLAIITSNDIYRESLKTALSQIPRFKVRLECRNCSDAIMQIAGRSIDVVLINSAECEDDPGGFVKQIHMLSPNSKILMLLDHTETCWYAQAMKIGADDVVLQYADKDILVEHIWGLKKNR
jgi:DNA-binding NarL/FixJ family response regulator